MNPTSERLLPLIRGLLVFFMAALIVSGATAFPIPAEMRVLDRLAGPHTALGTAWPALGEWIGQVAEGVAESAERYPFLFYGTDWLAFAHIVIAIGFIGPLRDPVRNVWYVQFGLICCVLIFPLAFVCGSIRGVPFFWQWIDCSFGLVGGIVLLVIWFLIRRLEKARIGMASNEKTG